MGNIIIKGGYNKLKKTNKKNVEAENIQNSNDIKTNDDFSWGGNTIQWQKESKYIAMKHRSYKGEKKYKLK